MLLGKLLAEILLEESVNAQDVNNAIDNHERVIISYHSDGKDNATGSRVIEVYAYGLTKSGNPVIRAFQPYGDTTSKVPSWKLFRLDRIDDWKPTGQKFTEPASDYYTGMGQFNPNGDKTMGVVYKVAQFDDGDVFMTDAEKQLRRTKQSMLNPININNLNKPKPNPPKEPKLKDEEPKGDTYKTPSEREAERFEQKPVEKEVPQEEPQQEEQPQEDNLYKTDTERGMADLRNKIANATKIDLSKIPKR